MKAGFKIFLVYRLRQPITQTVAELNELLAELPAGDPAPTQMRRSGFINPISGDDALALALNKEATLVSLQTALRIVPNKIVKRELAKGCAEWEEKYARVPTPAEKQELKNRIIGEMMETALIDYERMNAILSGHYIYIDTTSVKKAETFLGALRHQLKTLPVHPLTAKELPVLSFTEWVNGTETPAQLTVQEAFKAKAKLEDRQVLTGKNVDLDKSSLSDLLGKDYQVVALELGYYNDNLHGTTTFMLNEHLHFKSVIWPDALVDMAQDDAGDDETGINLAKATWLLTAGALEDLRDGVMVSLGGEATLDADNAAVAEDAIRKAQDAIFGIGTVSVDGEDLKDPLYGQVVELLRKDLKPSISAVQRKFRIGYNRATRIIESLEAEGIISAPGHNGNREVLHEKAFQLGDTDLKTDFQLAGEDEEDDGGLI